MNNQTTDSRSGGTPAPKSDPMTLGTLPIGKLLVQYSVPAIIASVAMSLYNIIDSIFIGRGVGAMAIAGLAITFPLMNLVIVSGLLEKKPNYLAIFAKPVIASAVMGAAAWASHGLLGRFLYGGYVKESLCTILAVGIAVVVYLILVISMGMITKEDLRMVPHGAKLAKILRL